MSVLCSVVPFFFLEQCQLPSTCVRLGSTLISMCKLIKLMSSNSLWFKTIKTKVHTTPSCLSTDTYILIWQGQRKSPLLTTDVIVFKPKAISVSKVYIYIHLRAPSSEGISSEGTVWGTTLKLCFCYQQGVFRPCWSTGDITLQSLAIKKKVIEVRSAMKYLQDGKLVEKMLLQSFLKVISTEELFSVYTVNTDALLESIRLLTLLFVTPRSLRG